MSALPVEDDRAWQDCWGCQWQLRAGTIYLNHGSFGPPSERVRAARQRWQQQLDSQPMDFYVRALEPAWRSAREQLARFLGTGDENLAFVENATAAMNVVADSFPLQPGDEVLLNDHEYGAVHRIWQRACRRAQAAPPRIARLPQPIESVEQVSEAIFAEVTDRTRLIVISHITSPTALILPVQEVCRLAGRRGIAVCVDGPHAPAQLPLQLDSLGCDFYTASCHKWLSAAFGSGFLWVAPKHHEAIQPPRLSWGRLPPNQPAHWSDEFLWTGTGDPSAYLTVPVAIELLEAVGQAAFAARTHFLARYARQRLSGLTNVRPIAPDNECWYGSMVNVPLPPGDAGRLQRELWQRHGIEVPVIDRDGQRSIRVSCHLYNSRQDIDRLVQALKS